jgi:hypothetical protein
MNMTTQTIEVCNMFGRGTAFRMTARQHAADLASFNRFVTVSVDTGACNVQTYLTPDECEKLACMFMQAAADQRKVIASAESLVAA